MTGDTKNFEIALRERLETRLAALAMKPMTAERAAGIPHQDLYAFMIGKKSKISAESLVALAPILQVDINWLLTGIGGPDIARDPLAWLGVFPRNPWPSDRIQALQEAAQIIDRVPADRLATFRQALAALGSLT